MELEKNLFYTYIIKSHGKQHGGWEVRQTNPKLGQRRVSPNAVHKNLTGQRPGLNCSVWKLLLLIYESGVYW